MAAYAAVKGQNEWRTLNFTLAGVSQAYQHWRAGARGALRRPRWIETETEQCRPPSVDSDA